MESREADYRLDLATFPPAKAAVVTGLSQVMQRDWRQRGYLPQTVGHARFNVLQLAEMWTLKILADQGIGPKIGTTIASSIARHVVQEIAVSDRAFGGEQLDNLSEIPGEFQPPTSEIERASTGEEMRALVRRRQLAWMTNIVLRLPEVGYPSWQWLPLRLRVSEGAAQLVGPDEVDTGKFIDGPYLLVNPKQMAAALLDRLSMPVFNISFGGDGNGSRPA